MTTVAPERSSVSRTPAVASWPGQDDMGGTSANRLTNQTGGLNGDTLGATGGAETHTLTEAEMPAHVHPGSTVNNGPFMRTFNTAAIKEGTLNIDTVVVDPSLETPLLDNTGSTGSSSAHNNVQPTLILNKIIKH